MNKAKVRAKRSAETAAIEQPDDGQALSSASSLGDWRLLFIQRDRIAAVTAADVNRVAKIYFQKPNRTVGVYIPARESTRLAVPALRRWSRSSAVTKAERSPRRAKSLIPLPRTSTPASRSSRRAA